jgi:protocatechuate 3,4-dioxygenase beta subunit
VRANVTLLVAAGTAMGSRKTDDRGRYRFGNLRPGRYFVMASRATASPVLVSDGAGRSHLAGAVPSFYPGASTIHLASVISTEITTDVDAVDLQAAYAPIADVEVSVTTAAPINRIRARQVSLDGRMSGASFESRTGDGTITFAGVPAGHWLFTFEITLEMPGGAETFSARHETATDGAVRQSVSVTLEPPARISGTVVYEGGGPAANALRQPDRPSLVEVSLSQPGVGVQGPRFTTAPGPGGAFALGGVLPGTYTIHAYHPGTAWMLQSAMLNGRDLLDVPLELAPASEISGLVLTLGERATEVSGAVTDAAGRPLARAELAVVAADSRFHYPGSRRVRTLVTAADGTYVLRGLPPGEYRIGPAPRALTGAALLQVSLPNPAFALSLAAGERKVQNLVISR